MRKTAYKVILVILSVLVVMALIKLVSDESAVTLFRTITNIITKEVEVEKIKTVYIEVEKAVEVEVYWYQFHATGYSPDDPSQGTNRTMASGKEVYEGSIAADASVIPIGTKVYIMGLPNGWDGEYVVEDTGGAIKGLRIDVFRESYFDALQINQQVWVRILEE